MSGFRHKTVAVPEWEGVKVVLREPSGEAWLRWQEVVKVGADDENVSVSERPTVIFALTWFSSLTSCATPISNRYSASMKKTRFVKFTGPFTHAFSNRRLTSSAARTKRGKSRNPRRKVSDGACAPHGAHALRASADHDGKRASDVD